MLFSAPVCENHGALVAADRFQPVGFRLPPGPEDNRLLPLKASIQPCAERWNPLGIDADCNPEGIG
jgi:hypothetical protein